MNSTQFSASSDSAPAPASHASIAPEVDGYDVFQRIGLITRRLHDALHELGYDKKLENAVDSLPDARARLSYIAKLTGESAEKVLNTVELARATQDETHLAARELLARWQASGAPARNGAEDDGLIAATRAFLEQSLASATSTNEHLSNIMLAQDFHDLTGQVIRKVVDLAQTLEEQLLALLLETTPPDRRAKILNQESEFLSGPAVQTEGRTDIVTSQSQVDDMLESLGF